MLGIDGIDMAAGNEDNFDIKYILQRTLLRTDPLVSLVSLVSLNAIVMGPMSLRAVLLCSGSSEMIRQFRTQPPRVVQLDHS